MDLTGNYERSVQCHLQNFIRFSNKCSYTQTVSFFRKSKLVFFFFFIPTRERSLFFQATFGFESQEITTQKMPPLYLMKHSKLYYKTIFLNMKHINQLLVWISPLYLSFMSAIICREGTSGCTKTLRTNSTKITRSKRSPTPHLL